MKLKDEELELNLPQVTAEYLVLLFYEAGICGSNMNGVVPLSWSEIIAWKEATQRELDIWETSQIMAMSKAYVSERVSAGDDPNILDPITRAVADEKEQQRLKAQEQMNRLFDKLGEED